MKQGLLFYVLTMSVYGMFVKLMKKYFTNGKIFYKQYEEGAKIIEVDTDGILRIEDTLHTLAQVLNVFLNMLLRLRHHSLTVSVVRVVMPSNITFKLYT